MQSLGVRITIPVAFSRPGIAAALALVASSVAQAQEYVISTYAGGAPPPTPVAGVSASIAAPLSVATDAAGNVYFASDNCVFKLDTNGVLTRVAGNSRVGYSGDGGPATSAQLYQPAGVAVDGAGDLYVADTLNQRVRKVSPAGIITTIAGGGADGLGDGGPATSAQLSPEGVAVDAAGNLYIADSYNGRVRKVSPAGIITTIAGGGADGLGDGGPATSAQLSSPQGVAVDGAGNLYIADFVANRVRKVSPGGIITTIAGNGARGYSGDGGPATSAELSFPAGVAVDGAGDLYIADNGNYRVRKVSPAGIITTVAGNGTDGFSGDGGPATSAQFQGPQGVAVDGAGNLYIADIANYRVRKVSPAGIITTVAGNGSQSYSGDGGPAGSAQLFGPEDVAVDGAGNLYIADSSNNRVRAVSAPGIISTVAGNGVAGYSGDGGPASSAQLAQPSGVAVDAAGNLYIADPGNSRIREVSLAGIITTVAGNGTQGYSGDSGAATSAQISPYAIAVDSAGNLYIAEPANDTIRRVSPSGIISTVAGGGSDGLGDGGPATSAQLQSPLGVEVDGTGNLYIADYGNQRVRKVSPEGTITTIAGNGLIGYSGDGGPATSAQFCFPSSVAVDGAANLYIADSGNGRVRKISAAGIITTIAGDGKCGNSSGYSGDGGLATGAQLYWPTGIAVDSAGRAFVADTNNNAVRLLEPLRPIPRPRPLSGVR
jgi:trimeric autotransporter adhesin